jgi:hypothetical protein
MKSSRASVKIPSSNGTRQSSSIRPSTLDYGLALLSRFAVPCSVGIFKHKSTSKTVGNVSPKKANSKLRLTLPSNTDASCSQQTERQESNRTTQEGAMHTQPLHDGAASALLLATRARIHCVLVFPCGLRLLQTLIRCRHERLRNVQIRFGRRQKEGDPVFPG